MRFAIIAAVSALAALALAACGQPSTASKADGAKQESGGAGLITLGSTADMPDWLLVARTRDGGFVHFNQRAITRNADGTADIWVQVTYGQNQLYQGATDTTETVIRYRVERLHYRFNCAQETFTVSERQIMGEGEQIVARSTPEQQLFRGIPPSGAARVVMPVACRGS